MDTIFVSLFTVVMLIVSTLVMAATSLFALNRLSDSFQVMEQRASTYQRSGLDASLNEFRDTLIVLSVQNTGQVGLSDFESWSVLLQHQDGSIEYLAYSATTPPAAGAWALEGIHLAGGGDEVFDPGILNPDEVAYLVLNPATALAPLEVARITIMSSAGTAAECQVLHP